MRARDPCREIHMVSRSRSWRVGLVGLGSAAINIHVPALETLRRVEIVGGHDTASVAGARTMPVFDSLEALLERARPEIVCIVTPPGSHYVIAKQCLEHGVHVFCEKPFVETIEQGLDLIGLCRARSLSLVVNQEFRYMQTHAATKARIGHPDFGDLQFISASQSFRTSPATEAGWRGTSNRRTCHEFGIHVLDLCRYFFDEEPLSISARMPKPGGADGPDLLNLIHLEFSGDRAAQITLDRLTHGPHRYLDMRLDGTKGCIESSFGGLMEIAMGVQGNGVGPFVRLERRASASAKLFRGERGTVIGADPLAVFPAATARLFGKMLDALEAGSEPPCNAMDNLKTLALMLAAYESAERKGERIDVGSLLRGEAAH